MSHRPSYHRLRLSPDFRPSTPVSALAREMFEVIKAAPLGAYTWRELATIAPGRWPGVPLTDVRNTLGELWAHRWIRTRGKLYYVPD